VPEIPILDFLYILFVKVIHLVDKFVNLTKNLYKNFRMEVAR